MTESVSYKPVAIWFESLRKTKYKREPILKKISQMLKNNPDRHDDVLFHKEIKKEIDNRFTTKMPMEFFSNYDH